MKPKTKIQKEVARLSATLRPITATQTQWAYSQCFEHIAYRGKNGSMVCSECAHEWTAEGKQGNKCRCPKCGAKLTVSHSLKRKSTQIIHFAVVTTRANFQVIRVIHDEYNSRKGEKAEYIVNEALQRWFDAEGNEVNIARKKHFMPRYCDAWNFDSDMEIRSRTTNYNNIPIYATYPKCRVLPIIRRNGFNGFHYTDPYDLLKGLMSDNKVETLVKTRQYGLLSYYLYRSQYRRDSWQLIRICLRHGYKVKDVTTWYDHINTLERLGMDTHNPIYLCPQNLRSEHNRLVELLKRRDEKERVERERNAEIQRKIRQRKDDEAKKTYPQRMSRYLDLVFSDGLIEITVLQSAEEFYNEGEIMHHCVYSNAYYAENNSLVMSAHIGDKRIETIEIDLRRLIISQSHGAYNQDSKYHNRIVSLVQRNLHKIARRANQKTENADVISA